MSGKHTLRINPQVHRDETIWKLYKQCGGERTFPNFIKDVLYELSLSVIKNDDTGLLSLNGNGHINEGMKPKARKAKRRNSTAKPITAIPDMSAGSVRSETPEPESAVNIDKSKEEDVVIQTTGVEEDESREQPVRADSILNSGF